jgi:hypothetical protein
MLLQIAFGVTGEMKSNHRDNWRRGGMIMWRLHWVEMRRGDGGG